MRYAIVLLLCGCATTTPIVSEKVVINPPAVSPMQLRDVHFRVLDGNITLEPKQYENLALNMQDIKRYILTQAALIKYYETLDTPRTKQ